MCRRHTFWQYRKENPKSRVGEPPPDGLPGFNSGVMLLNLDAMRHSTLYNQLLEPERVARLAEKYHFRGHLGDQDFFTMIGMEHRELFYPLSCGWNRQLCTWWREHGYGDVFQLYYHCDGPVHIYHGNCNTPLPDDWGSKCTFECQLLDETHFVCTSWTTLNQVDQGWRGSLLEVLIVQHSYD